MYVTTFYSFKGGVGRSMALANAAVELAKRGRRVLVVDFDLEAPGLDTFDVLRPPPGKAVPGIIDFVREFLDVDRAPDARRFLARLPDVGDRGGELWIMPSGAQEASYAARFNEIDWAALYEKRDGYLLFEDLKAQWREVVKPDYVLVDSRTGHTDTGGICTRQLPDAVAILFFPNEQNLRGLAKVVRDIRAEAEEPRRKPIELHFIMSNVPDLDDEDRILENNLQAFRNELKMTRDPLTVHRYDSLALLNQSVFTRDRPYSRLAREYRGVVEQIVGRNLDDRDGALAYLKRAARAWRRGGRSEYESPGALEKKLRRIEEAHFADGEVLFQLGTFREDDPRAGRATPLLFDRAIESGYREPEVYLQRAHARARGNDPGGASADALRVLQFDDAPSSVIWQAVALIRSDESEEAAASPAIASLDTDERMVLAKELERPDQIEVSMRILEQIVDDADVPEIIRTSRRGLLAMRSIAAGACDKAAKLLCHAGRRVEEMDVIDAFNYGMALWGTSGAIVRDPFVRVVELDLAESSGPDYWQYMAVACWATGDLAAAAEFETRAEASASGSIFSCWRYAKVQQNEFIDDMDDIKALIGGDKTRVPRFMRSRPTATRPAEPAAGGTPLRLGS